MNRIGRFIRSLGPTARWEAGVERQRKQFAAEDAAEEAQQEVLDLIGSKAAAEAAAEWWANAVANPVMQSSGDDEMDAEMLHVEVALSFMTSRKEEVPRAIFDVIIEDFKARLAAYVYEKLTNGEKRGALRRVSLRTDYGPVDDLYFFLRDTDFPGKEYLYAYFPMKTGMSVSPGYVSVGGYQEVGVVLCDLRRQAAYA